jgi:pimeloyl-ACP methyl ester carboxylesterase
MTARHEISHANVSANELDFGLLVCGPADGDAPLALCLHGYPDSAWTWQVLLPELAAAGYRAVAPFSRGYAPTSIPSDGRYQSGVLGVDANALHEALGGKGDAVLIGHDWGAMGAYSAASLEPDRWRRVVTAAVPPGPVTASGFFNYDQLRLSWYIFFQLTPMAEPVIPMNDYQFIHRIWRDWSPGYDGAEFVRRFVECMATPEHLAAALGYYRQTVGGELQDPSLSEAQTAVFALPPQPLLYLHGDNDGCMSPELAATTGDHLTVEGSRMVMIEDAGHFLHLERPAEVNSAILDFLAHPT